MPDTSEDTYPIVAFVDTNIFVRYFTWDHPEHSPAARQLFEQIESGAVRAYITDTVIFETVYTLESFYKANRQDIADAWLRLFELPGLVVPQQSLIRETLALWVSRSSLSYADCFHLVSAKALGIETMVTFDRKMSAPGVTRTEPPL